jgi:sensor histidine kinase YesM
MTNIFREFLLQLAFVSTLIFTYQIFFAERSELHRREKIIRAVLFGASILFCMSFPAYFSDDYHVDIRIIPLLLGTLYCGRATGIFLSALIVLYRLYVGIDMGLYTTVLALLICMPVILIFQKRFTQAKKNKRILIALILLLFYSLVGLTSVVLVRGYSYGEALHVHYINMMISIILLLLSISLNEKIKEMIEKNRQLQIEAKEAEIAFLRSQIKPHFLYNALNSIAALCIDEPHKAGELTLDLSKYLRSGFNFKQLDSLTTIENELELVEAYVNIEKVRFGARLCVEYEVDADPDTRIPPLILQPLVENAIRHGLMSNLQGGTVKISVKKKADATVHFVVEDNGSGMSEMKRKEILQPDVKKKGIGLWNISQRLQLLYGTSLHVESAEGTGTKISFAIPVGFNSRNKGNNF